jgi:hypothetical protein
VCFEEKTLTKYIKASDLKLGWRRCGSRSRASHILAESSGVECWRLVFHNEQCSAVLRYFPRKVRLRVSIKNIFTQNQIKASENVIIIHVNVKITFVRMIRYSRKRCQPRVFKALILKYHSSLLLLLSLLLFYNLH